MRASELLHSRVGIEKVEFAAMSFGEMRYETCTVPVGKDKRTRGPTERTRLNKSPLREIYLTLSEPESCFVSKRNRRGRVVEFCERRRVKYP